MFTLIFLMAFGIMSITMVMQAYRKYNHKYLLGHGLYLILLNLIIFLSLINNYVLANLFPRFASKPAVSVEIGYRFIASIVLLSLLYTLLYVYRRLLQKPVSRVYKHSYFWLNAALLIILTFIAIQAAASQNAFPILVFNISVILLYFSLSIAASIFLLSRTGRLGERGKRKAVAVFGSLNLLFHILFTIFLLLHILSIISNDILIIFFSTFWLTIYAMPVLYLKRFMEMYHGTLEITQGKVVSLGKIYKKYKISKREQEVILLICEGKTNKEIEDELFISLQTVKDHIYRIYQKTGVKNRVQLTNLFRHASKNSRQDTRAPGF